MNTPPEIGMAVSLVSHFTCIPAYLSLNWVQAESPSAHHSLKRTGPLKTQLASPTIKSSTPTDLSSQTKQFLSQLPLSFESEFVAFFNCLECFNGSETFSGWASLQPMFHPQPQAPALSGDRRNKKNGSAVYVGCHYATRKRHDVGRRIAPKYAGAFGMG